jgi:hypothetical protein
MKPISIELTGTGSAANSDPVRVNWRADVTTLSFGTDGSTTGFTAQFTMEPPEDHASASAWASAATWHDCETISGVTANASEALIGGIQGVRLQADANGTDTGTLWITQATK